MDISATDLVTIIIGIILLAYIWKTKSKLKKIILRSAGRWTR